jgi:hypothetical protein
MQSRDRAPWLFVEGMETLRLGRNTCQDQADRRLNITSALETEKRTW